MKGISVSAGHGVVYVMWGRVNAGLGFDEALRGVRIGANFQRNQFQLQARCEDEDFALKKAVYPAAPLDWPSTQEPIDSWSFVPTAAGTTSDHGSRITDTRAPALDATKDGLVTSLLGTLSPKG